MIHTLLMLEVFQSLRELRNDLPARAIALLYYFKIIEGTLANVLLAPVGIFLATSLIG